MSYQPDPQKFQQPSGLYTSIRGQGIPGTNPYIRYTLFDGIVGFIGSLVVLYTQSLEGTFFIFLCAFIAFYRGIRAILYANHHPATPGRATGIVSLILGGLSIVIMIYLFATVGVH